MSGQERPRRIIPCLDVKDGRVVKGVRFEALRDAGDPVEQAATYQAQGADELAFLDISATVEGRKTLSSLVAEVASRIDLPFLVGGGVRSVEDAAELVDAGAHKVLLSSAALSNPDLIDSLSSRFGAERVVIGIDARLEGDRWTVWSHGATRSTGRDAVEWVREVVSRGAGEILLTSIDRDGTRSGFDVALTRAIATAVSAPVIASGGAGKLEDFSEVFLEANASAALAASLFHFGELSVGQVKSHCVAAGVPMRWSVEQAAAE